MAKIFEVVLKATGRNSYGSEGVKGADMIEKSGSLEKAPKKQWISRLRARLPSTREDSATVGPDAAQNQLLS